MWLGSGMFIRSCGMVVILSLAKLGSSEESRCPVTYRGLVLRTLAGGGQRGQRC